MMTPLASKTPTVDVQDEADDMDIRQEVEQSPGLFSPKTVQPQERELMQDEEMKEEVVVRVQD